LHDSSGALAPRTTRQPFCQPSGLSNGRSGLPHLPKSFRRRSQVTVATPLRHAFPAHSTTCSLVPARPSQRLLRRPARDSLRSQVPSLRSGKCHHPRNRLRRIRSPRTPYRRRAVTRPPRSRDSPVPRARPRTCRRDVRRPLIGVRVLSRTTRSLAVRNFWVAPPRRSYGSGALLQLRFVARDNEIRCLVRLVDRQAATAGTGASRLPDTHGTLASSRLSVSSRRHPCADCWEPFHCRQTLGRLLPVAPKPSACHPCGHRQVRLQPVGGLAAADTRASRRGFGL